ncbi:MAG: glycoside hydrolase family 127 protein, partial [Lachnospiraceae bacterium]|nr:glycoside hydrolase family 127 protein [Lachnospiraceae bacterium]
MKYYLEKGYLYVCGAWDREKKIELSLSMEPRLIKADERVKADEGRAALLRGPVVYCMEEWDNGKDLENLVLSPEYKKRMGSQKINGEETAFTELLVPEAGEGTVTIEQKQIPTIRIKGKRGKAEDVELTFIPYYTWANRGENEMQVWTVC